MQDEIDLGTFAEPHDDDELVMELCEPFVLRALGVALVLFALLCALTDARAQDLNADPRPEEPAYENEGGLRDTMRELAAEDRAAHEEEVPDLTLLCLPPHGRICRPATPPAAVASTPE